MNVTLGLALLSGVFSFLSPCVLPLVPSYLSVVAAGHSRAAVIRNALGFILGFSTIFFILGASLGLLGQLLREYRGLITQIGGVLVVMFGLQMLGLLRLPWFSTGWAGLNLERYGVATPIAIGAAFATGWTPCIGPILGTILTLATSAGDVWQGLGLLAAYNLGLAVPFLLTALASTPVLVWARKHRTAHLWFNRLAGLTMIVMGVLVATNTMTQLNSYLIQMTPAWLWSRL